MSILSNTDLDSFFDDTTPLRVNGKTYRIPAVDERTGAMVQRAFELAVKQEAGEELTDEEVAIVNMDDAAERNFYKRILGTAYEEMSADGVSWPKIQHCATTMMYHSAMGEEAAAEVWTSVGKVPKAPSDHMQKKKPAAKSKQKPKPKPSEPSTSN